MASEPKKPIEQMLEALAKARRAEFGDDAEMPNPMRARLHEEIVRVLLRPESRERLASVGVESVGGTPAQLAATIKDEVVTMGKVIREDGIQEK